MSVSPSLLESRRDGAEGLMKDAVAGPGIMDKSCRGFSGSAAVENARPYGILLVVLTARFFKFRAFLGGAKDRYDSD